LAGVAILALIALDSPSVIDGYRVGGERSITVVTFEGTGAWTRVARVAESESTVTVEIRSIRIQVGPGTAVATLTESTVALRDPIGQRTVIDGSSGQPVQRRP
jgi:hypothetical protein